MAAPEDYHLTSRTSRRIVCECGHQGSVERAENDQPYSNLWEQFSVSGFTGEEFTITSFADMPKDLLAALKPCCPKCGQTGKVKYVTEAPGNQG